MLCQPITGQCESTFEKREHACFGISPFNSYFSESKIQEIASWGKKEFESMHFFVPDVPSSYTLEALGYDSEKAAWKARRQSQYLHNKIERALKGAGFSNTEACHMVLNWEVLSGNTQYLELYEEVKMIFERDPIFRRSCIEASRWVLEKRVEDTSQLTEATLFSAARYLLTEIPLFIDTPSIVGKESSVFCYHQSISFLDNLFQGTYSLRVSDRQGFAVIAPKTDTYISSLSEQIFQV